MLLSKNWFLDLLQQCSVLKNFLTVFYYGIRTRLIKICAHSPLMYAGQKLPGQFDDSMMHRQQQAGSQQSAMSMPGQQQQQQSTMMQSGIATSMKAGAQFRAKMPSSSSNLTPGSHQNSQVLNKKLFQGSICVQYMVEYGAEKTFRSLCGRFVELALQNQKTNLLNGKFFRWNKTYFRCFHVLQTCTFVSVNFKALEQIWVFFS